MDRGSKAEDEVLASSEVTSVATCGSGCAAIEGCISKDGGEMSTAASDIRAADIDVVKCLKTEDDRVASLRERIGGTSVELLPQVEAEATPLCTASIDCASLALPVSDGTDQAGYDDAGRAPNMNQQTDVFKDQILGILALSVKLNGDPQAMILRYRAMVVSKGGDVAAFDEAVSAVFPIKEKKSKKKSKRAST